VVFKYDEELKGTDHNHLVLSVKRSLHRRDDPASQHADQAFASVRNQAIKQGQEQCFHCSIKMKKWLDVHHQDDNHNNNDLTNLVPVCKQCHGCHHLGLASLSTANQYNGGFLVYLPEINQVTLNILTRMFYIFEIKQEKNDREFRLQLANFLDKRRKLLIKHTHTHFTAISYANALLQCSDEDYHNRNNLSFLKFVMTPSSFMAKIGTPQDKYSNIYQYWAMNYQKPYDEAKEIADKALSDILKQASD